VGSWSPPVLDAPLYPVTRTHLAVLTDHIGIMQHAIGRRPDPAFGYCVDDVARALQVDLLHVRRLGWSALAVDAWRSLRFLSDAFEPISARFRNFRDADGSWLVAIASDDCQGRAMHALGDAIATAPDASFVLQASALFELALPGTGGLGATRAISSVALGCVAAALGGRLDVAPTLRLMAERLWGAFGPVQGSDWPWPEPRLTYENGLPLRALIVVGQHLGDRRMVEAGIDALDWLMVTQTAPEGHLSPVGNGWWSAAGPRGRFDQQPIEAATLMLAAEAALFATGDDRWRIEMERAYAWFLGGNDLGVVVADPGRGGCHDGLTAAGVNLNQGAESTLMWLVALEHIRAMRRAGGDRSLKAVSRPIAVLA